MGRPRSYTTSTVDQFQSIDIGWLRRQGAHTIGASGRITWSRNGNDTGSIGYAVETEGIRLRYTCTPRGGTPEHITELIALTTTQTRFGGFRYWFVCPSCARRCRLVYGGARFRCRLCQDAKYQSQYDSAMSRCTTRRWKIRRWLKARSGSGRDWPLGLDYGLPPKPPRIHWATYDRLVALDQALARRWQVAARAWLDR